MGANVLEDAPLEDAPLGDEGPEHPRPESRTMVRSFFIWPVGLTAFANLGCETRHAAPADDAGERDGVDELSRRDCEGDRRDDDRLGWSLVRRRGLVFGRAVDASGEPNSRQLPGETKLAQIRPLDDDLGMYMAFPSRQIAIFT